MDVRKIVSFGNSSFVISLPKKWVISHGLKKGDSVYVDERNSELIVSGAEKTKKAPSHAVISAEGKSLAELKTEIFAAYVNNYSMVSISGGNVKDISPDIKRIIHGLVGMEVVEETASSIVVKDLMDLSEVSIDSLVRRMDILLKSMLEDSAQPDRKESVSERDKEVNRLALLSARIFKAVTENPGLLRIFGNSYWDMYIARQVAFQLEHIGDNVKRASRQLGRKGNEDLRRIFSQLRSRYLEVMKVYYTKDKEAAYRLESDTRKFLHACDKLIEKNRDVTSTRIIDNLNGMSKAMMYILRTVMESGSA
ncbi:phosphate uptake regulator PhoU [Candidatus Woesearchaeota archaeon]|nr:phosphate uptake regulator PhoU [Candidatus Woesearchaeota archaeon]